MRWQKMGLIFQPENKVDWCVSHAALPIAEHLDGDLFRVYFSGRDHKNRAQIGYFVIDLNQPHHILDISQQPIFPLGTLGAFDDSGTTGSCLVKHEGKTYHYYSGWTLGVSVPFYFYVGLAIDDGSGAQRVSPAPILERNSIDPYLTASPFVLVENGMWRMWYVSALRWESTSGGVKHYYLVKYAESSDGIAWRRDGRVCIPFTSEDEYAIARPCVIHDGDVYRMWYSCRGQAYRAGYAESADGLTWERKDEQAGIDVSESGWDSEMIAYPHVFDHRGTRYMLYNGSGYGRSGIGLAVLE